MNRLQSMSKSAWPAALVLALAACAPPHPHIHSNALLKTIARLDCPTEEDELKLQSAAADGRSCLYIGPAGEPVSLQLIDLHGGDAQTALAPLTADLKSELPSTAGQTGADKDRVDIDLPGVHIHASGDDSDRSHGATVTAGDGAKTVEVDKGSNVTISRGQKGVVINAGDNGAEIHVSTGGSGNRLMFILASETPGPHGYRLVGYEARGPIAGPLAVISVKSTSDEHDDDLRHAMGALLRRNVGG